MWTDEGLLKCELVTLGALLAGNSSRSDCPPSGSLGDSEALLCAPPLIQGHFLSLCYHLWQSDLEHSIAVLLSLGSSPGGMDHSRKECRVHIRNSFW